MCRPVLLKLCIVLVVSLCSCNISETIEKTSASANAIETLNEYSIVSKHFYQASNSCTEGLLTAEKEQGNSILKSEYTNAKVTVAPKGNEAWPVIITVDYGDGVVGKDGIMRKGKLQTESSNWYQAENSIHITTFENYYQDNHKLEGVHIASNKGKNAEGFLSYNIEITEGELITPEGKHISYAQQSMRTQIVGTKTPLDISDDEYLIDGSQVGVSSNGLNYTLQITKALHFVVFPRQIKDGVMMVNVDGLNGIEMDYNAATITIGGLSYPLP